MALVTNKKVIKDYLTVLFGNSFSRGIQFVNTVLIARFLGTSEFGKFSIFYIAMILTWQLPQAFDSAYVRYAKNRSDVQEKIDFLKISVFIKLIYCVILSILSYPIAYFVAHVFLHKNEVTVYIVISIFCGIFLSFLISLSSIFQEKEKFFKYTIVYSFYTILILIGTVLVKFFIKNITINHIVSIFLAVTLVVGCSSLFILFRRINSFFSLDLNSLKLFFSFSKWIFYTNIVYFFFQRMDLFFLARYLDFKLVGVYSAALQIVLMVSLITGSLSAVFLPKSIKAVETKQYFRDYLKGSLTVSIMANFFILTLVFLAPVLISFFYGHEYMQAVLILRILLFGWIFFIAYLPFSLLFYALDYTKVYFYLELLKFLIGISLLIILVPKFQIYGAAISISSAMIFNVFLSSFVLFNLLKKKLNNINV